MSDTKELPWEEYRQRYANKIVEKSDGTWSREEALEAADAAKGDFDAYPEMRCDPEGDAEEEMLVWDNDGDFGDGERVNEED